MSAKLHSIDYLVEADWEGISEAVADRIDPDADRHEWHGFWRRDGAFELYPSVVSVRAVAEVHIPRPGHGADCRRVHRIFSDGLCGVHVSGADDPYLAEVKAEELAGLMEDLAVFGIETGAG
ncbi:MAG: hypothetical protein OXG99_07060 [Alphaproteobacteria bacterium]|nr:hypothetical protein [Alphaproteobacteria bacterium]